MKKRRKQSNQSYNQLVLKVSFFQISIVSQSNAELMDAGKAIKILGSIYKEQETEIHWCITYLLNNTNTSSSGLVFTNPNDLKRFLKIGSVIFPISRWRFRLKPLKSSSTEIQIKKWHVKNVHQKSIKKMLSERVYFPVVSWSYF